MKQWWCGAMVVACCSALLWAPPVEARSGPLRKLGRGIANMATGWAELPLQIAQTTERTGSTAGLSVGVIKGVVWTLGRTAMGVLETALFLVPNYPSERHKVGGDPYRHVLEPELILFRRADKP